MTTAPAGGAGGGPILVVEALEKWFAVGRSPLDWIRRKPRERVHAVDGVSLRLLPNEVLGIVGESGSGKSTLARCLVSLYRPDRGSIFFDGVDVTEATGRSRRDLHGRMQMIYQDPFTSLNPQMSIGAAIEEAGRVHGREGDDFVGDLLDVVGLPRSFARRRPRALSGGQRQRAAIARALAVQPDVLIADEAVSALDVSIQAQILNLFARLSDDLGLAMIFIAHDLAVVSHVADRVAIMYLGRIVEEGPVEAVFGTPRHPYTRALLDAHPDPYALGAAAERAAISGDIPSPLDIPSGCRFRTRCPYATDVCETDDPALVPDARPHRVACHVLPFGAPAAG
jgi:oligopeptide/dipeptide ABC transporter ATP-binding protein